MGINYIRILINYIIIKNILVVLFRKVILKTFIFCDTGNKFSTSDSNCSRKLFTT